MLVSRRKEYSHDYHCLDTGVVHPGGVKSPESCLGHCRAVSRVQTFIWFIELTYLLPSLYLYESSCAWAQGSCTRLKMRRSLCMVPLRTLHHSGPDRISPGTMFDLSNDANIPSENDTSIANFKSAWMTDRAKIGLPLAAEVLGLSR